MQSLRVGLQQLGHNTFEPDVCWPIDGSAKTPERMMVDHNPIIDNDRLGRYCMIQDRLGLPLLAKWPLDNR